MRYLLAVQALQSQHRDGRVRAAPAEPGPEGTFLKSSIRALTRSPVSRSNALTALTTRLSSPASTPCSMKSNWSARSISNLVSPIDGLQDRVHLVIPILTTAQYAQIEINLGERLQLHRVE